MTPQQANLPCPCCGSGDIHDERYLDRPYSDFVICNGCGLCVERGDAQANPWDVWNRRAPAPTEPAVDRDAVVLTALRSSKALIEQLWSDHNVSIELRELDAAIVALATPASPAVPDKPRFKDHDIRQLVNDLRAIAVEFHAAGQLRERISGAVQQFLAAPAVPEPAPLAPNLVDVIEGMAHQGLVDLQARFPNDNAAQLRHIRASIESDMAAMNADFPDSAPQVAQASQPTSAEGMTAWAAYCPAGFQFIHADQRVVEDFVYTRRYCGEGPYSIMHMKVSRPTSAEGKDSERLEGGAL